MHFPSHTRVSLAVIVRWQGRSTEVATVIICDHSVSYVPHFIHFITCSAQKFGEVTFVFPVFSELSRNIRLYAHTKPLLDSFVVVFFFILLVTNRLLDLYFHRSIIPISSSYFDPYQIENYCPQEINVLEKFLLMNKA